MIKQIMVADESLAVHTAGLQKGCDDPNGDTSHWEGGIDLRGDAYRFAHTILVELLRDTNARCIFLIDVEGRTIDRVGNADELPVIQIENLLGSRSVSFFNAGILIASNEQATVFIYQEGEWGDTCLINVGGNGQLVMIINKGENKSRMGSLYFFGKKATVDIARELEPMHVHGIHEEILIKNVIIKEADQLLERS